MNDITKEQLLNATKDTIFLVFITGLLLVVIGLSLGYMLYFTSPYYKAKQTRRQRVVLRILSMIVDIFRSIPFVILVVLIIPLTIIIMGTMLGASDVLIQEPTVNNPYVNIVATRVGNENSPKIVALVSALTSSTIKTFINDTYAGAVIAV